MQLIGMLDSPYVRRVAVAALMAGLKFWHRPISLLLKAPTFVADDGTTLVESSVILEYLATLSPTLAALMPAALPAFRATGLALTICEKAVQFHYERALRSPEQRSETWIARVVGQLDAGLEALERDLPEAGGIGGGVIGVADITVATAFGFTQIMIADIVDKARWPRLAAFSARAEDLPAFRAAPPVDGVTAPVD